MSQRVLLLAFLACACSDPGVKTIEDPYQGSPFPDRREHFALPAELGLVSNSFSDSLTLLDLGELSVVGSAPVGRDPVGLDGPHHLVVDRRAGVVFTALSYPPPTTPPGPHAAHGSSQQPGYVQKLALDDLRPLAEVSVETNPGDIVLSEDGSLLAVSHFDLRRALIETKLADQRADVVILDPAALGDEGTSTSRLVRTCIAPHGIALARPSGELAYVACYGEDALAVLDTLDENAAPELVSIGPGGLPGSPIYGPYAAVLSPDGSTIAVSNTVSKDVRFFEVASRSFRDEAITLSGTPYFTAWSSDGERLFIPIQNLDALMVYDVANSVIATVRTFEASDCKLPHAALFGHDRNRLFLVCEGDHESPSVVLALSPDSLDIEASLPVGVYPDGLAIAGAP